MCGWLFRWLKFTCKLSLYLALFFAGFIVLLTTGLLAAHYLGIGGANKAEL